MFSTRILALALFALSTSALLEERFVEFQQSDESISIHNAAVVFASDDPVGINIASKSLVTDFELITGSKPQLIGIGQNSTGNGTLIGSNGSAIIVGTVDSHLIKRLVANRQLNVDSIQGKWETFQTSVVARPLPGIASALVIAGSDKRGAMFGAYTLSEQCGQSPFHWWADVPATKHDQIFALPVTTVHGEPSVKYRGLFINDEAPALTGWWAKKHNANSYPLDTEFYEHVFDLLLRLKGNYIWPAMWKLFVPRPGNIFFTDDPGNIQLADDYGIVVSTSHHEPMQRATNEWNSSQTGIWKWSTNKDNVTDFMEEGVRRAANNESYFTLGMRGPADGPLDDADPISILTDVFKTQREILSRYHGNASVANQVWTIYKEVATYHAAGLVPPDDVTLMFTDDNWGNAQRLPTANESERSGGVGLYYHLEYFGRPKSYKWHNNNNLAKVFKDFYHTYQRGADRIWVVNVGDIKPMELPFGFIMDLAWNTSTIDFETIPEYVTQFARREFGDQHADEIADVLLRHNHLIGLRKFESVNSTTYSVLNYHESERILGAWQKLGSDMNDLKAKIDPTRSAAFFHLVEYPIRSGLNYHSVAIGQGQNYQFAYERRNSANVLAQKVLSDFDADYDLLEEYDALSDGKWLGFAAQAKFDMFPETNWKSPARDVISSLSFVQMRQNFEYNAGNLGIYAEHSLSAKGQSRLCPSCPSDATGPTEPGSMAPTLPRMDPYGPRSRTVDIFHRGDHRVYMNWSLDPPVDWLSIMPTSGTLSQNTLEQRLNVSVDWSSVPENWNKTVNVTVTFDTSPWVDIIRVPVTNTKVPSDFRGFPETAGFVSIEAPHFQRSSGNDSSASSVSFHHIPNLGTKTTSGAISLRPYRAAREKLQAAKDAWVDYDFYLFTDSPSVVATIFVNGALDTDPNLLMEYSLSLDSTPGNFTRLLGTPANAGDVPPGWTEGVTDQVWARNIQLGRVTAGKHTLRWRVNSPEIYLEKVVLDFRKSVLSSYLGPPESTVL